MSPPGNSWVLDSGASFHMTPDSTSLTSVGPPVFPISFQTADGTPLSVSCQGTLLSTDFSVPAVSHVPQLTIQLLSVGQLTDLGCRVIGATELDGRWRRSRM